MIAIENRIRKGKFLISALVVKLWAKNRTPVPSAPWTQQMTSEFSLYLFRINQEIAGKAIIL